MSSPGRIVLFSNVWLSIHWARVGPSRSAFSANSWLVLLSDDRLLDSESDESPLLTRCSFALTGMDTLRLFHGLYLDHNVGYLSYSLCFGAVLVLPLCSMTGLLTFHYMVMPRRKERHLTGTLDNLSPYKAKTLGHPYAHSSFSLSSSPTNPWSRRSRISLSPLI